MKFRLLFTLFSLFNLYFSQNNVKISLFPEQLNYLTSKANFDEPRFGINYLVKTNDLKVDIGNSMDVVGITFDEYYATLGIDFFAFALATSFSGNRLQIDALDGFFGGSGVISRKIENDKMQVRLRILHNSAHFVDGHWEFSTQSWMNNDVPIPYTRDFGELTFAYNFGFSDENLKLYSSLSYSSLVRPNSIKKWLGNSGFEWNSKINNLHLFDEDLNYYISSHFFLDSTDKYNFNTNSQVGIKIGNWWQKGVAFYLNYYKGNHFLSEYYQENVEQFGIGFSVDYE